MSFKLIAFSDEAIRESSPFAYNVSLQGGKVAIALTEEGGAAVAGEIDLSACPPGTVLQAVSLHTDVYDDFAAAEIMRQWDSRTFALRPRAAGRKIAVAVKEENGDVFVCLLLDAKEVTSNADETLFFDRSETDNARMIEHSPCYAKRWRDMSVKAPFLSGVDIYNSASYMEAQLDTVTRLLLSILPPEADADLKAVLEAADGHSVLGIKDAAAVKAQMETEKAAFRAKQIKYYEDREAAEGNNAGEQPA
jgi:hypothetical protein